MATAWEAVRMDEATFRGRGAPRAPPREGSVMPPRSLRTPWGWSPGETPLPEGRRQHLEGGRELPRHRRDGVQPLLSAWGPPSRQAEAPPALRPSFRALPAAGPEGCARAAEGRGRPCRQERRGAVGALPQSLAGPPQGLPLLPPGSPGTPGKAAGPILLASPVSTSGVSGQ